MNFASTYTLTDEHHNCTYLVPAPMMDEPKRIFAQAMDACTLLYRLNEEMCDERLGPFRTLVVFNPDENADELAQGQIMDAPREHKLGGQG